MSAMVQFPIDLPDVEVLKTELTAKGHLVITVKSTLEGTRCRRCGQEIKEPHGHDRPLRLRHLAVLERPVTIEIRPKRYRCPYGSDPPPPNAVAGTSPIAGIPEPSSSMPCAASLTVRSAM